MANSQDRLVEGDSIDGLVLLNYGDPAYRGRSDSTQGLKAPEAIFLRLIAYLVFAEAVSVPSRYILEGNAMASAVAWATPLLEEGILIPERRTGPGSFEDLARQRQLAEISVRRAEFLDRHAARVRTFRFLELSGTYRDLLTDDLSRDGAFRRTVPGGTHGKYSEAILKAYHEHLRIGDGLPETFVQCVARYAPQLQNHARRWAMARYYTTPLQYDAVNTREIPVSAANLLIQGKVLDSQLRPFEKAAPAEAAFERLKTVITAHDVAADARLYCEAVMEVRRSLPEARKTFADIRERAQLKDAGDSLSELFTQELNRQRQVRSSSGRAYTLVSSLLGGAAGVGLGLLVPGGDPGLGMEVGVASGVGSGIISNEVQKKLEADRDRKRRPWLLAMDKLERTMADS